MKKAGPRYAVTSHVSNIGTGATYVKPWSLVWGRVHTWPPLIRLANLLFARHKSSCVEYARHNGATP